MLKSKFILGLSALFIIVTSFGFYGYSKIRNSLVQEQIEINLAETRALEARISRWLERRKTEISTLANTPVIRSMDWSLSGPFLKQKHDTMPWFYIFAHINPDGTYYNSKVDFAEGQNLSDRAHFQASINGRVYASDPVVSRTLGTDIVAVTSPIYNSDAPNSKIIGVFGGMIDTTTIVEELGSFSNGVNSYAFAVNSNGIAISHPDTDRMGNINTNAESLADDPDPGLSNIVAKMLEGTEGWERILIDGQDAFVTFTPVTEANWFLATVTDANHVNGQLTALNIASAFVAIVLAVTFYMVLRLRNAEAQRLETEKSVVEEKNRAKSNFLANVSHELRTPLNAIIGYSDLLQSDLAESSSSVKRVEAINRSGKHLLALINRILDLAKVEAGKLELDNRPADLQKFLNETVKSLEITAQKYPIAFSKSVEIGEGHVVNADTDKLAQIINNITTNAFKYGGSGRVTFSAQKAYSTNEKIILKLIVTDEGIGMTISEQQHIFNEFEQIDTKSSGLGLGLAIVKQLVTLMKGEIEIFSVKGKGTTVKVEIPFKELSSDESLDTTMLSNQYVTVNGQRKNVLVIDDNDENSSLMMDLYKKHNFEVSVANDGDQGIELFNAQRFDLVITDIVMPKKNGFEVIREIRNHPTDPTVPIIVASASAFASDQEESLAAGANKFMAKPIDIRTLLETTCELLKLDLTSSQFPTVSTNLSAPTSATMNTNTLALTEAEQQAAWEIIELAEVGRFSDIRKRIENIEGSSRSPIWSQVEDRLNDFDSDGLIDALKTALHKSDE